MVDAFINSNLVDIKKDLLRDSKKDILEIEEKKGKKDLQIEDENRDLNSFSKENEDKFAKEENEYLEIRFRPLVCFLCNFFSLFIFSSNPKNLCVSKLNK